MSTPAGRTILASTIAKTFVPELEEGLAKLGRKPLLVGFIANQDPAARTYAEYTEKVCHELGFAYEARDVQKEDLEEKIMQANVDDHVDGIIVYFPVFGGRQDQYIQQVVDYRKDVEGLSHIYIHNLYQNIRFLNSEQTQKSILPCTPLAVVKIMEYLGVYNKILEYGNRLYGKTVLVVNRSEIVGRPLAALLANDGAVVYSADVNDVQKFTRGDGLSKIKHQVTDVDISLKDAALQADVIITGVPSPEYKFPDEFVKYGAVCINFSSVKNFNVSVKEHASLYVPMTGKVTIMMLLRNLLRLCNNRALE